MAWADTWVENTTVPESDWRLLASSQSGGILYALDYDFPLRVHKSTDGGLTWAVVTTVSGSISGSGHRLICDPTGQYVYVTALNSPIKRSSDYGATWTSSGDSLAWNGLACSSDGSIVYAAAYAQQTLFKSTDYGATWNELSGFTADSFKFVECTSDGAIIYLGGYRAVQKSTNGGASWTEIVSESLFSAAPLDCCAISTSGTVVYIGTHYGLWVSTNSGTSFTKTSFSSTDGFVYSVSCSSDGSRAISTYESGSQPLYVTEDSGATWTTVGASRSDWSVVRVSGDASTLMAGVFWGRLFNAHATVAPSITLDLFMDGFDAEYLNSVQPKWASTSGSASLSASGGRRGSGCLILDGAVSSVVFPASSHVTLGMAILATVGGEVRVSMMSSEVVQIHFVCDSSDGLWKAYDSSDSLIATASTPMLFGVWKYVEFGVLLGASGAFELHLGGNTVLSGSTSMSGQFDQFRVSGQTKVDDLYLVYGNALNFFGNARVDALALDGNSTPQDWTPDTGNAWERLNQDAGFISADTVGQVSNFSVSDLAHAPSTIHGIQVTGYADSEGTRSVALQVNGTQGSDVVLGAEVSALREAYLTNPDTSANWTPAEVDALEVGAVVTV